MPELDLAVRVTRYLDRQIHWFETVLEELDGIARADTTELQAWGARQERRTKEMETLENEHHALLRDWRGSGVPTEEERSTVLVMAKRAETLRKRLAVRYDALLRRFATRMDEERRDLATLRKGYGLLEKYRPGGAQAHDFLDRKA